MVELYTQDFLIDKLYDELNTKLRKKSKLILEPPQVSNLNKRTYISNFRKICSQLNREELLVQSYFESELSAKTSIDQNGCLIISAMFRPLNIETIFKKYVQEYVSCPQCSCCETILIKKNRVNYISCNRCLSEKSVKLN